MQGLFWCPIIEETAHPSNFESLRNAAREGERSFGAGKVRVFVSCVKHHAMEVYEEVKVRYRGINMDCQSLNLHDGEGPEYFVNSVAITKTNRYHEKLFRSELCPGITYRVPKS